ncbi:Pheromone a factor receptor [Escovopsis weberi]|uniref:Pheromone a factor receptor n=1 Tax=Escovopsis weberi TaxID=150374 RepID=A0A0M8MVG8_ESCWE|nr:Pheromone a factor receptor [Escovopsis weberi]
MMDPSIVHLLARNATHAGPAPFYIVGGNVTAPYTSPSLTANLVARVALGLLANLACVVPLQLLAKNGELAAVVFIANLIVTNTRNVVNAVIWSDDDAGAWWLGAGLCDADAYVTRVNISLFATCLLAVMRNLAIQVGSLRANPLSQTERRRRNLVQALIMFPLPALQLAFVYPLAYQRYWIGTLVGCTWSPYPSWPYVVFFVFPPMIIAVVTAVYAVLVYKRYREVAKTTTSALSSNRTALLRTQRTKRRLYLMVISILIPFLPIVIALGVGNMLLIGPLQPFVFVDIHAPHGAHPWSAIPLRPSDRIAVYYMNNCYVPILTAVPVFLFFGMTKDAVNSYRRLLVALGLAGPWPSLRQEYDPDRSAYSAEGTSSAPRTVSTDRSRSSTFSALKKLSSITITLTSRHDPHEDTHPPLPPPLFNTNIFHSSPNPNHDLNPNGPSFNTADRHPYAEILQPQPPPPPPPPPQPPFLFRTRLNLLPSLFSSSQPHHQTTATTTTTTAASHSGAHMPLHSEACRSVPLSSIVVDPEFPSSNSHDAQSKTTFFHVARHPEDL